MNTMNTTYKTFKRSCTNWLEFSKARKVTVNRGLSWAEAKTQCELFNSNLTSRQIKKGTRLEFDIEN